MEERKLRSFTVVEIRKPAQLNKSGTFKKTKSSKDSRLLSKTPAGAASKAFTAACNSKDIRGQCTLVVTIQETTRNSAGKTFMYECKRLKLDNPIELQGRTIEYENKIKSLNLNKSN